MKNLIKNYLDILTEEQFADNKWVYFNTYNNFEIYFNLKHVKDRLNTRYNKNEDLFIILLFLHYIIDYIFENNIFENKNLFNKTIKHGLTQGFTFNGTKSNVWICGVIQKDLAENKNRLYCSTVLSPTAYKHRKKDIQIILDI